MWWLLNYICIHGCKLFLCGGSDNIETQLENGLKTRRLLPFDRRNVNDGNWKVPLPTEFIFLRSMRVNALFLTCENTNSVSESRKNKQTKFLYIHWLTQFSYASSSCDFCRLRQTWWVCNSVGGHSNTVFRRVHWINLLAFFPLFEDWFRLFIVRLIELHVDWLIACTAQWSTVSTRHSVSTASIQHF